MAESVSSYYSCVNEPELMVYDERVYCTINPGDNSANEYEMLVPRSVQPCSLLWFYGSISRRESEELLTPHTNGLFLVRESNAYKGDYTLCVSYLGGYEYYHIKKKNSSNFTIDDELYFDNLVKLVKHYLEDSSGLCCLLNSFPSKKHKVNSIKIEDFIEKGWWLIPQKELKKVQKLRKYGTRDTWIGSYHRDRDVAINVLEDFNDSSDACKFLDKLSTTISLSHKNLVTFIGVSVNSSPMYIVTEIMTQGCLLDYLCLNGRMLLSQDHLMKHARDVCQGLVYLHSKSIIFRYLSSRNVYISENGTAKISSLLTANDQSYLLMKWMPPETLRENQTSFKSDVWSFGVLLWELFSYGYEPYRQIPASKLLHHLSEGNRLELPDGCPKAVYRIMSQCWDDNPKLRPSFTDLILSLPGEMHYIS